MDWIAVWIPEYLIWRPFGVGSTVPGRMPLSFHPPAGPSVAGLAGMENVHEIPSNESASIGR